VSWTGGGALRYTDDQVVNHTNSQVDVGAAITWNLGIETSGAVDTDELAVFTRTRSRLHGNRSAGTPTPTSTPRATATATSTPRTSPTATNTPRATPTATATPRSGGAAAWAPNVSYAVGALATYNGTTYRCIQAHTSQTGWEPPNTPALWAVQ
jgi:hypothetical protein